MRRHLPLVLVAVFAFAGGWIVRGAPRPGESSTAIPLGVGRSVTVVYPTGEVVTGMNGAHPTPKMNRVTLTVYRHQGSEKWEAPPAGAVPWQLIEGDTVLYALPN